MSYFKQEKRIENQPIAVSIENMKKIISQMENCICIIYTENRNKGTGFICKTPLLKNPVLITNNHVLNKNEIKNGKIIKLIINNKKPNTIEIDNSRVKFTNPDKSIDITIIEIKPKKDGIGINNYLELDENDINKNEENIELEYPNKSIYILHHPKGKIYASFGLINYIKNNKTIYHFCNTEEGSSGSPILSLETFKVIGIHCGCYSGSQKVNYGTSIKYIMDLFNKPKKILYKGKEKPSYPLFYNEETLALRDKDKNHYNYNNYTQNHLNHGRLSTNENENYMRLTDFYKRNSTEYHGTIIPNNSKCLNMKYTIHYTMKTKENSPSNIRNYYEIKTKSLRKKNNSNNILFYKNKGHLNNEDFLLSLNKRISFGYSDKKRIMSKSLWDIKEIDDKKNQNLKIDKGKSEKNAHSPISNKFNNFIRVSNNFRYFIPQTISNKNEKFDENFNNNLTKSLYCKNGRFANKFSPTKKQKENDITSENNNKNVSSSDNKNKSKKIRIPFFKKGISPKAKYSFGYLFQNKNS